MVDVLPFLEESALQDAIKTQPSLVGQQVSPLTRNRITLLTCPDGFEGDSELSGIPAAHYVVQPPPKRNTKKVDWVLSDGAADCRLPWIAGPERNLYDLQIGEYLKRGPHSGGFLAIRSAGNCFFVLPD